MIKITFESEVAYLPFLRKAIHGFCSTSIKNEQILQEIDICLHEALSNVIYHAYLHEPGHLIQLIAKLGNNEVAFDILDSGIKNPNIGAPPPEDLNPADITSIPESGRGLFIIYQLMDEVKYSQSEGKNILSLRKCF